MIVAFNLTDISPLNEERGKLSPLYPTLPLLSRAQPLVLRRPEALALGGSEPWRDRHLVDLVYGNAKADARYEYGMGRGAEQNAVSRPTCK